MRLFIAILATGAALAGCVAVPYDAGPPPPGAYYSRPTPPPPGARRDYDRDGVPDPYDRRPENPYRH